MTLIVETGAGLSGADSYASLAQAQTYADQYGLAWTGTDAEKEIALRRGTRYVDATFGGRFPGYRRFRRLQALEWPREQAFVRYPESPVVSWPPGYEPYGFGSVEVLGEYLPNTIVPPEVVRAAIMAAVEDMGSPGGLTADSATTGGIKRESAGDHSVEYFQSTSSSTSTATARIATSVGAVLAGLLAAQSGFTARAARA